MKKISIMISFLCLAGIFHIYGQAADVGNVKQSDSSQIRVNYENPLKGFSSFVFMAAFPSATKQETDIVNADIKKCLSSFGKVIPSSLIAQTDENGEEVDFSGFAPGGFLHYEITDVTDVTGKKLDILKATLTFTTGVEICKTKKICMPVVWCQSCFPKGKTSKKMAGSISKSLTCLLEFFQKEYLSVNKEKPVFYFYQS